MKHGSKLFMYYAGLGDALLLNSVLFEFGRQSGRKHWVGTNFPEMYKGNPHVRVLPGRSQRIGHQIARMLKASRLVEDFEYVDYYQKAKPEQHILSCLSERVGLKVPPARPLAHLSAGEQKARPLPKSELPWVAIQSAGNTAWTENKNWGAERFETVAKCLHGRAKLVQIGAPSDPPLTVDLNLCGRLAPRTVFAVLRNCSVFIGQVGFLMHAAAAVNIPAVIVYGGFEAPWQSGYTCNVNLYSHRDCAPCWKTQACPNNRICLEEISPKLVVESAITLLEGIKAR